MPKSVTIDGSNNEELSQLLMKSCNLGTMDSVLVFHVEKAEFTKGALLHAYAQRQPASVHSTCKFRQIWCHVLCAVCPSSCTLQGLTFQMFACRPVKYFRMVVMVPATLNKLILRGLKPTGKDLAPLARLTLQVKAHAIESCLTSPLAQLPAPRTFVGVFSQTSRPSTPSLPMYQQYLKT